MNGNCQVFSSSRRSEVRREGSGSCAEAVQRHPIHVERDALDYPRFPRHDRERGSALPEKPGREARVRAVRPEVSGPQAGSVEGGRRTRTSEGCQQESEDRAQCNRAAHTRPSWDAGYGCQFTRRTLRQSSAERQARSATAPRTIGGDLIRAGGGPGRRRARRPPNGVGSRRRC